MIKVITSIILLLSMTTSVFAYQYSDSSKSQYTVAGDFTLIDSYSYSSQNKTNHEVRLTIGSDRVYIDGSYSTIDEAPYISSNGRTMLPLRAVTDIVGAFSSEVNLNWDSVSKKVILKQDGKTLVFTPGSNSYTSNGITKSMESCPEIRNSRIFLPIRVIAEELKLHTDWDNSQKLVTIKTP